MNNSLMFYPWCKRIGERVLKRGKKDKGISKRFKHKSVYMNDFSSCFFFFAFSPRTYMGSALSTSAE